MEIERHFPEDARELIQVRGRDLLDTLGLPALRGVVTDVLGGTNIRNATESLTRRRLALLNAAMMTTYASLHRSGVNALDIPDAAHENHQSSTASASDKVILRWMLGLTNKQVQNVLRSDEREWRGYIDGLRETLSESAEVVAGRYGRPMLGIESPVAGDSTAWEWALSMMMAVGAQTLAIRGAEKSMYGKFFEKLILGSVLSVLGFDLVGEGKAKPRCYWLSTRGAKRESDATAIWRLGQGVRFDIGFIGVGNPEITLDKVSRFEREIEINGMSHYMHTFVIVDRVGKRSRIPELAADIGGTVIQMSANDWVVTLGGELERVLPGYTSPIGRMGHREYAVAIKAGVEAAPLEEIFEVAVADASDDEDGLDETE